MQRNLSADWIYTVNTAPIKEGVLTVSNDGEIVGVYTAVEAAEKGLDSIERYEGVLVPGFVNTHCHLELSHLLGKIAEQTGLPAFVKEIVAQRAAADEVVLSAMKEADKQMYNNGIVAVGDIANQEISLSVKKASAIYYHTFVEVFGFNQPSKPIINNAVKIKKSFWPLKTSIVPHAPYSVSEELFRLISEQTQFDDILSIHNQETAAENEFFEKGSGSFEEMYLRLGVQKEHYHGAGKNSIRYHLPRLPQNNLLLVHNTFTSKADVDFAQSKHENVYWCFCPNANIYIEDSLPDYTQFLDPRVKITLGTDSLASNHQLSILSEMCTLQQNFGLPFDVLLKWGTLNGAKFLGIDSWCGSFEVGKKPSINLIGVDSQGKIKSDKVKRLI
jgi:cytosine/adenosine deaminase-related metal-dependent hydrolase